jgi:hypothetical protein
MVEHSQVFAQKPVDELMFREGSGVDLRGRGELGRGNRGAT